MAERMIHMFSEGSKDVRIFIDQVGVVFTVVWGFNGSSHEAGETTRAYQKVFSFIQNLANNEKRVVTYRDKTKNERLTALLEQSFKEGNPAGFDSVIKDSEGFCVVTRTFRPIVRES